MTPLPMDFVSPKFPASSWRSRTRRRRPDFRDRIRAVPPSLARTRVRRRLQIRSGRRLRGEFADRVHGRGHSAPCWRGRALAVNREEPGCGDPFGLCRYERTRNWLEISSRLIRLRYVARSHRAPPPFRWGCATGTVRANRQEESRAVDAQRIRRAAAYKREQVPGARFRMDGS